MRSFWCSPPNVIAKPDAFQEPYGGAAVGSRIVTFGTEPTRAATSYGYSGTARNSTAAAASFQDD